MHNEGYSSMCGHGIIAAVSAAIETKSISIPSADDYIGIDSPAGSIKAFAKKENEQLHISFENVPSFVETQNQTVFVDNIGRVEYDKQEYTSLLDLIL